MRKTKLSGLTFVGLFLIIGATSFLVTQWVPTAGAGTFVRRSHPAPVTATERAAAEIELRAMAGGQYYKPLRHFAEFPGVAQPDLKEISEINLPDKSPIVGVEVDGVACAFVLESMQDPSKHIVNLLINDKPISVTYCNFVNCVRVLSNESKSPIPLNVGGMDIANQLVLLLNGERYDQESGELPLVDYAFTRMSWGDWKRQHPNTKICYATAGK